MLIIRTVGRAAIPAVAAIFVACGGCSSFTPPWSDDAATATSSRVWQGRSTVVVAPLENPAHSLTGWSNIGSGMSAAIREKLGQRGDVDVGSDSIIIDETRSALAAAPADREARLRRIGARHPEVACVVTGEVTEFTHVAHKPNDLQTWGPSRSKRQAVAAARLTITDLRKGAARMIDRVEGIAWVDDSASADLYRGMSFASARFTETPLGLASRDAASRAAEQVRLVVPREDERLIRIVDQIDEHRVRLDSAASDLPEGAEFQVCATDARGGARPILDPVTRRPVTARVDGGISPSAWLIGKPLEGISLRGAVLCRKPA